MAWGLVLLLLGILQRAGSAPIAMVVGVPSCWMTGFWAQIGAGLAPDFASQGLDTAPLHEWKDDLVVNDLSFATHER